MPGVVIVVIPLGAIFDRRAALVRREQACAVVVIFQHEVDVPAARLREFADGAAETQ